uniref:Protein kinase domain-containing protein n=1 Tax=Grammatophora oceanica TaxID=210454 RepID=A0A7S1UNT6_9STRA|mmetsp:Transcript_14372/g.21070  ORF Transcript_14372/g.21070 Transcript_14372/m.21070 type:complete len:118 (+) Transcript_14372:39-392(+)
MFLKRQVEHKITGLQIELFASPCRNKGAYDTSTSNTLSYYPITLVDFGVARLVDHDSFSATGTGWVGWSDPYVEPEFKDPVEKSNSTNVRDLHNWVCRAVCLILGTLQQHLKRRQSL